MTRTTGAKPAVTFEAAILGILGGTMTADQAYDELTADPAEDMPADPIAEFAAKANAEAAERGGYQGPVCPAPKCNAVAYAFKAGHQTGCVFGAIPQPVPAAEFPVTVAEAAAYIEASGTTPEPDTMDDPAAQAARDALMGQACGSCGAEADRDGAEVEHLGNCPDAAAAGVTAPAGAEKVFAENCTRCGFRFPRPQVRQTCQSERACQRRQHEAAVAVAG